MKKISKSNGEMLSDYDFSGGVRGKYAKSYAKGSNVVVLDPDVAKLFSTSKMVNRSLRGLAKNLEGAKSLKLRMNAIVRHVGGHRWNGVPVLNYKEEGSHFKAISRQVLFEGGPKLGAELRYFEIDPGGHSTLERHDHIHSVMIIRGRGHCLVGDAIYEITGNDLVYIPSMTWHQFRATTSEPLGFLCLVNVDRDRPERPDEANVAALKAIPKVGEFIRL